MAKGLFTWQTRTEDVERGAEEIRSAGGVCETLAPSVVFSTGELSRGVVVMRGAALRAHWGGHLLR
jgi:hypothetical protein